MKKILITLFVISMLAISAGFVFAAKANAFDSNGVEKGWEKTSCTTIQDGILETTDDRIITTGYDQWGYNYQAHMFNGLYCDSYRDVAWCQPYKDVNLMMKWNDAWLSNVDCDNDSLLDRHYGHTTYIGSGAWLTNHQSGEYNNWNIEGAWVLEFDYLGTLYIHNMIVTDNTFVGTGGYPAGGPYTTTWTVTGTINGDNIEMTIDYDDSSYYVDVVGTIAQDGTMSGSWDNPSQSGTWMSSEGEATLLEVCKWNYFVKIVAAPADAYVDEGIWYTANETEIGEVIWGAFAIIQQVENDPCAGLNGISYNSPSPTGFGFYN